VAGPDGLLVMNSSGIVTLGKETYIIAAYTMDDGALIQGFNIVRHICSVVGARLTAAS
jgi:glycerate-2-kinase